jgi:hypothetical protein
MRETDPTNDASRGERSRNGTEPPRVERRVSRPDPLGNIIGRREADIEHANEQRSTGSANVDAAQAFEPKVSLKPTSDATQTDSGRLDRCVSSDDI